MTNPALTTGQVVPGYWGHVDYGATASPEPQRRALLWGYIGASATATPNRPFLPSSEGECNDKSGGANTALARWFRAAIAQDPSAEIWCMPIVAPSGGVQATYKFKVCIPGTNPAKAGTLQLWVMSQLIGGVSFSTTDTETTVGDAIVAQLLANDKIPIASAVNVSGIITITYLHKGTDGEDFPVRCTIAASGTGVNLSPAQLLFASNAVGSGSVLIDVGAKTITVAIAGADTPAQIAAKVVAAVNADTYPVTAVVNGSTPAQVDLYFNTNNGGWDVRRIDAAIVTSTGTTVNVSGTGATDGTGSSASKSSNGTIGTGAPSLTAAITNLQGAQEWYRSWMTAWVDTASLGTMASYLESGSDGSITGQKLQVLTFADWRALSVAGGVSPAVSPSLNGTPPHYGMGWSPDAPVQAGELAARAAVARAAKWIDTPEFNWNEYQFVGSAGAPILAPNYAPSMLTLNSALRTYALSPWVLGASGSIEITKGRTTSLASDRRLHAWSCEAQASYHIVDAGAKFKSVFGKGNIVRFSEPKAAKIFDNTSVEDIIKDLLHKWEKEGNYDGADKLEGQVKAKVNGVNVFRFDADFPESPVLDLDQIVYESHMTQPSQ